MISIALLRELFAYQDWADSQIVAAVKAQPPAAEDGELRRILHHILVVQRFFLAQCAGRPFDSDREMRLLSNIAEVEELFRETHAGLEQWMDTAAAGDLARVLDAPALEAMRPSVATALLQTVLHSQHHRGQAAARLRALGLQPPTVDYIVWKKDHR